MYSIYADDVCVYNDISPSEKLKVTNPKLVMEDNSAGSLTVTLPPFNPGYASICRMRTDISVRKRGEEIWAGRVLSESKDFYNNRVLTCEGELAYFNDTSQPPAEYAGLGIRSYIKKLLDVHNAKVEANRQFTIGAVTVEDDSFPTFYTNYEKTLELLNALVETYGGHLRIRKVNGIRYLDYLKDYPDTCSQVIRFGSNLIDFTRHWDSTEFATVIVPLGHRLDKSSIEALDAYLTIESVNGGSMYIQSDEAVKAYGWIEKTVTWDSVSDPGVLLEKAKEYLTDLQFDNMELEVSALDLHYLNVDTEAVKLLDEIRVISRPHGLDRQFPVTRLEIPLDNPEQTTFKMGGTIKSSLSSVNNQISTAIIKKIEELPKAHEILDAAKENATQIMNMATTGYITITRDDYGADTLYISNIRDYTKADKLWKWNMNGLGYSKDGGKTFGLAITMDGSIVADYITSGVLNADVIRAGVLKDIGDNFSLDFKTGKLVMKKGSINIGNGNFVVDEEGNLTARRGIFAGTLSGAKGTFGGVVQAADFLDQYGNSMMDKGKFTADYLNLKGLRITNSRGETTFSIDSNGNVSMSGDMTMAFGGSINWRNITNENIEYFPAYKLANDAYENRCTSRNVFDVLTDGGTRFGIFSDSSSNKLYINADYIQSGTIAADIISLSTDNGGFAEGRGSDGYTTTYGAMMYGSNGVNREPYIIVTNRGCRMTADGDSLYVGNGIHASSIIDQSDARIKDSIDYNMEPYEKVFMSLKPASFRFKRGRSGRRHTGFIAQDLEQSILDAGLTSMDLAAFIKEPVEEVFEDGIADYRYGIRYGEIVSLNTHMIQKLYRMLDELLQQGRNNT